jgi:L-threonylcarbamoyladenylate synthase
MNEELVLSVEALRQGGIVLLPADVSWGWVCDATHAPAVKRLLEISGKTPVVLMENPALLDRYVDDIPEIAWDLIDISVSPLTIIFSNVKQLAPELVISTDGLGFRLIREGFLKQLLQRYRKPLAFLPVESKSGIPVADLESIEPEMEALANVIIRNSPDSIPANSKPSVIRLREGGRIDILEP